MKRIITIAILLMLSISVSAQKKGYLSLNLGPSIPVGDFKKNSDLNIPSAQIGIKASLSLAKKLGRSFGYATEIFYKRHPLNHEEYRISLYENDPTYGWFVDYAAYSTTGFMIGSYASFSFSREFSFDLKAMAGYSILYKPIIRIKGISGQDIYSRKQDEAIGVGMTYLVNAGFKYNISNSLAAMIGAEFNGSKVDIETFKIKDTLGNESYLSCKAKLNSLNIIAGLALRI